MMIKTKNNFLSSEYSIYTLLIFHFLINIAIYFNTTTFYEISESSSNFEAYYALINGYRFLPINGYFFLSSAFIAFFLNELTGNGMFYYFILQILLSTITVFVVYKIILHITKSTRQSVIGAVLLTLYLEYTLLGSVFYNQVYEIFFVAAFILTAIKLHDEKKIPNLVLYALLILMILFSSMFFRKTLIFIYLLFIFLLLFDFKNKKYILKYSILTILSFIILYLYNPYKIFNSDYYDETTTLFWGHTMYGGHGGEGSFVYPENEKRYNERLNQYIALNKIDSVTRDVSIRFQRSEIKEFITSEPHKWVFLQVKKLFYIFGSVPQKDGLLMLYKGKIKIPWLISALILQLSYAAILIMFLLTVDLNYKTIINDKYKRIFYFIGIYLISGISLFSFYQERFRVVIFVCFFIPVIAMNFDMLKNIFLKENRRELVIKLIIILVLFAVWIYQAYEALYIYHDRYFKALE